MIETVEFVGDFGDGGCDDRHVEGDEEDGEDEGDDDHGEFVGFWVFGCGDSGEIFGGVVVVGVGGDFFGFMVGERILVGGVVG